MLTDIKFQYFLWPIASVWKHVVLLVTDGGTSVKNELVLGLLIN